MEIDKINRLENYSQVRIGDLFYTQGNHATQRGLFPVVHVAVRAGEFCYRYNGSASGRIFGEQIKDVMLLRVGEGELEVWAGERVLKSMVDALKKYI